MNVRAGIETWGKQVKIGCSRSKGYRKVMEKEEKDKAVGAFPHTFFQLLSPLWLPAGSFLVRWSVLPLFCFGSKRASQHNACSNFSIMDELRTHALSAAPPEL